MKSISLFYSSAKNSHPFFSNLLSLTSSKTFDNAEITYRADRAK